MTNLTPADVSTGRRLSEEATPGPWVPTECLDVWVHAPEAVPPIPRDDEPGTAIAQCGDIHWLNCEGMPTEAAMKANGRLIAWLRTNAAALLDAADQHAALVEEQARLRIDNAEQALRLDHADILAAVVDEMVCRHVIDARSAIADATAEVKAQCAAELLAVLAPYQHSMMSPYKPVLALATSWQPPAAGPGAGGRGDEPTQEQMDAIDCEIARRCLEEIERDPSRLVGGVAAEATVRELMGDDAQAHCDAIDLLRQWLAMPSEPPADGSLSQWTAEVGVLVFETQKAIENYDAGVTQPAPAQPPAAEAAVPTIGECIICGHPSFVWAYIHSGCAENAQAAAKLNQPAPPQPTPALRALLTALGTIADHPQFATIWPQTGGRWGGTDWVPLYRRVMGEVHRGEQG